VAAWPQYDPATFTRRDFLMLTSSLVATAADRSMDLPFFGQYYSGAQFGGTTAANSVTQ
jgi:hypothetical protein